MWGLGHSVSAYPALCPPAPSPGGGRGRRRRGAWGRGEPPKVCDSPTKLLPQAVRQVHQRDGINLSVNLSVVLLVKLKLQTKLKWQTDKKPALHPPSRLDRSVPSVNLRLKKVICTSQVNSSSWPPPSLSSLLPSKRAKNVKNAWIVVDGL